MKEFKHEFKIYQTDFFLPSTGFCQPPHSSMILEAVAAPLTGGMQILKVGKMVSLVGADEETFKRVPWIAPAWYGITAEVSWSI